MSEPTSIIDIPQRDEFFLDERHQINPVWLQFFQRRFKPGAWQDPSFENAWANIGAGFPPLQYRMTALGRLEIAGTVKAGVLGATAFTLPEGFRPTAVVRTFAVGTGTAAAGIAPYIRVHNTGVVTFEGIAGVATAVFVGGTIPLD